MNREWQQTFHILKSYLICIFSLTLKLNVGIWEYNLIRVSGSVVK